MNSTQYLQVLLSLLFQSTLLILFVWLIRRSVQHSSTRVQLWTSLYVSLIAMTVAAFCLPRLQWLHPWNEVAPKALVNVLHAEHTIGVTLLAVWVIGMLVVASFRLLSMLRLQRLIAGCRLVTWSEQEAIEHASNLYLNDQRVEHESFRKNLVLTVDQRTVEFRVGSESFGPFCYQLHQPVVVLPKSLLAGDPHDLRNVLIHELTHLRSRHAVQIFLEKTLQTVFWFQPLCWLSSRHAALDREFQCDDASSTTREATIGYLKTLIRVIENRPPHDLAAMPIFRQPSQMMLRAQRLAMMDRDVDSRPHVVISVMVILLAIACSQLWLPLNPLASKHSRWSAWPTWSAAVLHELGVTARDYETFDPQHDLYEVINASEAN